MKRSCNLLSLIDVHNLSNDTILANYLFNINIDYFKSKHSNETLLKNYRNDIEVIMKLITNYKDLCGVSELYNMMSNYYFNYSLPNISKEIDLLRFGVNYNLNIELKLKNINNDRIKKQLKENSYYMNFLKNPTYHYTYVAEENLLYYYNQTNDELIDIDFENFKDKLINQMVASEKIKIDSLFNANDYLISPLNNTERFLNQKYFLNDQQVMIKRSILKKFYETTIKFINLEGGYGTGKTLLGYDIANTLKAKGEHILIFHCGYLNEGHERLIDLGWNIYEIKNYREVNIDDYDLVIIDEVQRIYKPTIQDITFLVKEFYTKILFCGDPEQWLIDFEQNNAIHENVIRNLDNLYSTEKLTSSVRSNFDLHDFTKGLFNRKERHNNYEFKNIEILYFSNEKLALNYLIDESSKDKTVLSYTPSKKHDLPYDIYNPLFPKNPHRVIGQEFNDVIIALDENFGYNTEGLLAYKGKYYYHPVKMLYQLVTRSRNSLTLVLVNNGSLFKDLLRFANFNIDLEVKET